MPDSDPLPSLDELEKKIAQAQKNAAPAPEGVKQSSGVGLAMRLGVELVSGVAVGATMGYFLDRWLGTMPLFFLICFFLGTAAGFMTMYRTVNPRGQVEDK